MKIKQKFNTVFNLIQKRKKSIVRYVKIVRNITRLLMLLRISRNIESISNKIDGIYNTLDSSSIKIHDESLSQDQVDKRLDRPKTLVITRKSLLSKISEMDLT